MSTTQLRTRIEAALRSSSALAFATRAELDRLADELAIALSDEKLEPKKEQRR